MSNKLAVIIKESGLEKTKAEILLNNFQEYFKIASEWEKKAKQIKVTEETQIADMKMARTGRLFLREKRIAIEEVRKQLKEQSLREGKAIDGISNVLKALIIPIEEYLGEQEHFVENKRKAEAEEKRIEEEKKIEAERIAKEKAEKIEQERIKIENEKLKKEAEERERKIAKERREQEEKLAKEKAKAEAERRKIEEKARVEREKAEAEKQKLIDKQKKLQEKLANQIECPFCHKKFTIKN